MKITRHLSALSSVCIAAMLAIVSSTSLQAADLYWDPGLTGTTSGGGTGTWDLSLANWYNNTSDVAWTNGNTALFGGTAGTVTLGASVSALGLTFNTGGYDITNSGVLNTNVFNQASDLTVTANADATISAQIKSSSTATRTIIKEGSGTLTLAGAINNGNTSSNGFVNLTVNAGTVLLNKSGTAIAARAISNIASGATVKVGAANMQIGSGGVTLSNGGTYDLNGFDQTLVSLNGSGVVTNNGGAASSLTLANASSPSAQTYSGVIQDGSSALSVVVGTSGANMSLKSLTLAGANTYSGGTVLNPSAAGVFTFNINNGSAGVANASSIGTGNFEIKGGVIDNTSGSTVVLGTNNTQTWNGNFTFVGSNSLNLGTGAVSLGTNTGTSRTVTVSNNVLTVGGVISNGTTATGITKAGTGTLRLTGANTYTGATTISAGTLLADNSSGSATGTGNVSVSSGATLGGGNAAGTTGFIGGVVTLATGAHIAPGNSAGTLTLQSGLVLNSTGGSILDFELGATSDLLKITGGTFTGNSSGLTTVNIAELTGFGAGTYVLIDWTGATTSNLDLLDFQLSTATFSGGLTGELGIVGNQLQLSVVPEPSTWVMMVGGLGLLLTLQRGRRRLV